VTYLFASGDGSCSKTSAAVLLVDDALPFELASKGSVSSFPFASAAASVVSETGFLRLEIGEVGGSPVCVAIMSKGIIGLSISVVLSLCQYAIWWQRNFFNSRLLYAQDEINSGSIRVLIVIIYDSQEATVLDTLSKVLARSKHGTESCIPRSVSFLVRFSSSSAS
jgi:hypothetical protein